MVPVALSGKAAQRAQLSARRMERDGHSAGITVTPHMFTSAITAHASNVQSRLQAKRERKKRADGADVASTVSGVSLSSEKSMALSLISGMSMASERKAKEKDDPGPTGRV
jgi:hypothetical protein